MKVWAVGMCLAFVGTHVFAGDVPGSSDLLEFKRPIGSEIVRYTEGIRSAVRVPVEKVERVNNRLVIDDELDVEGRVIDITYQLTAREDYSEYVFRLTKQLMDEAEVLFSCKSRACGVSGLWANTLFKVRELYGPNGNQIYVVARLAGEIPRYLSIYGMERGNRRQYVHLRLIESNAERIDFGGIEALLNESRVILPVEFAGDRVSPESRGALEDVAKELIGVDAGSLAIVAFSEVSLGGGLDKAIRQSQARAEHVKSLLEEYGLFVMTAKGLGPLVPAGSVSSNRVELVKFQ